MAALSAAPEGTWPLRRTFLREGLILAGYLLAPVPLSSLAFFASIFVTPGSWAFPVAVVCGVLWFVGSLLAYRLAMRRFKTARPGGPAVRLYADRLEVDRADEAPWTFAREGLAFELRWFVGWHKGTGANRGFVSTSLTRLSQGELQLVIVADSGDLAPIKAHPELGQRDTELYTGWGELPRVRMWPADLVALGLALKGQA